MFYTNITVLLAIILKSMASCKINSILKFSNSTSHTALVLQELCMPLKLYYFVVFGANHVTHVLQGYFTDIANDANKKPQIHQLHLLGTIDITKQIPNIFFCNMI